MGEIAAKGLLFLRNIFAKHWVKNEEIKNMLLEDLDHVNRKLDKILQREFAVAHVCLADGLRIEDKDPKEAKRLFKEAYDNSLAAMNVVEEPLQKIQTIKISVTSVIRRYSLGDITEEGAKELVTSRLHDVNNMQDILDIIKRRIIGSNALKNLLLYASDTFQEFVGKFTKDTSIFDKADTDYVIIMEICRVYMNAIVFFDDRVSLHDTIKIVIPSSKGPYHKSVGYLLLATADRLAGKWASYENDILYHQRQMMYMLPMVEFAVKELGLPDGCKWHDSEELGTNVAILDCTRRYRFVNCNILKVQDSGNIKDGAEIVEESEQVEVIEVGECGKVRVRRNKHEGGFELDEKCVDIAEVEKQYQEILANNKLF